VKFGSKWLLIFVCGLLLAGLFIGGRYWRQGRLERSQEGVILAAANRYGVDPALVKSVVWRESRFNPDARGAAGELGLMQIGALAAQEWADAEHLRSFEHEQVLDPVTNTLAGTWYLAKMIRRYRDTDNPYAYALADYNAGRSNVLRWNDGAGATNSAVFLEQMTFPGTRTYIQSILERWEHYRQKQPASFAAAPPGGTQ
jgi:soluble lytic murein transglycosylase